LYDFSGTMAIGRLDEDSEVIVADDGWDDGEIISL
jgi:hypothetical protein